MARASRAPLIQHSPCHSPSFSPGGERRLRATLKPTISPRQMASMENHGEYRAAPILPVSQGSGAPGHRPGPQLNALGHSLPGGQEEGARTRPAPRLGAPSRSLGAPCRTSEATSHRFPKRAHSAPAKRKNQHSSRQNDETPSTLVSGVSVKHWVAPVCFEPLAARDSTPLPGPFFRDFLGPAKGARAVQVDVELVENPAVAVRWPGRFSRFAPSIAECARAPANFTRPWDRWPGLLAGPEGTVSHAHEQPRPCPRTHRRADPEGELEPEGRGRNHRRGAVRQLAEGAKTGSRGRCSTDCRLIVAISGHFWPYGCHSNLFVLQRNP